MSADRRPIELQADYPLYGRVGVGPEVWTELVNVTKEGEQAKLRGRGWLTYRSAQTLFNALTHCAKEHYTIVRPSREKELEAQLAASEAARQQAEQEKQQLETVLTIECANATDQLRLRLQAEAEVSDLRAQIARLQMERR